MRGAIAKLNGMLLGSLKGIARAGTCVSFSYVDSIEASSQSK